MTRRERPGAARLLREPRRRRSLMTGGRTGSAVSQISNDGTKTVIAGLLPDQSALHGLLTKVRDLGLTLISVRQLDAGDTEDEAQQ